MELWIDLVFSPETFGLMFQRIIVIITWVLSLVKWHYFS